MEKTLLTAVFSYLDTPTPEEYPKRKSDWITCGSRAASKLIGVYDTIDESVKAANEIIQALLSEETPKYTCYELFDVEIAKTKSRDQDGYGNFVHGESSNCIRLILQTMDFPEENGNIATIIEFGKYMSECTKNYFTWQRNPSDEKYKAQKKL